MTGAPESQNDGVSFEAREALEQQNLPASALTVDTLKHMVQEAVAHRARSAGDNFQVQQDQFQDGEATYHIASLERADGTDSIARIIVEEPGPQAILRTTYLTAHEHGTEVIYKRMQLVDEEQQRHPQFTQEERDGFTADIQHGLTDVSEQEAGDLIKKIIAYGPPTAENEKQI